MGKRKKTADYADKKKRLSTEEMIKRYLKVYAGAIYDVLEHRGLPNQVLSLEIKPLMPHMKVAGPAFTVCSTRAAQGTIKRRGSSSDMIGDMTPGCVIVYSTGREQKSGHWGEMTSASSYAHGAQGVVVDGGARDATHLIARDFPCFCRYSSPIEAGSRQRVVDYDIPILISGSLTETILVRPGDWVYGDYDGVTIIPQEIAEEVLHETEKEVAIENKAREELLAGGEPGKIIKKYGKF